MRSRLDISISLERSTRSNAARQRNEGSRSMTTTTIYFIAALSSARRPSLKRRRHHQHDREMDGAQRRRPAGGGQRVQNDRKSWLQAHFREERNRVRIS